MVTLFALLLFFVATVLFLHFTVGKDRGHREPKSALYIAAGFGLLALVIAGLGEAFLVSAEVQKAGSTSKQVLLPASELLKAAITIGVIEELAKTVPLALFIYRKRYFDELTDGVIYFGIAALTFAIIENLFYSIGFGSGIGIARIVIGAYVHVGFTILFGVALAYRKVLKRSIWFVLASLVLAIAAHALYDFFAFSESVAGVLGLLLLSTVLNVYVFVLFRRAQRQDEALGHSTKGENKFCRHCGAPNPERLLYCSRCGKLA